MLVTLSLPRVLSTLKSFHGLDPAMTDDEVSVRLDMYARDWFDAIRKDTGVSVGQLTLNQGSLGVFQVDISGTRRGTTADWILLSNGLSMLQPVCVSLERADVWQICDGLVGKQLHDNWAAIEPHVQRLSLEELHPTVEEACLRYAWGQPAPLEPYEYQDELRELQARAMLDEVCLRDPLAAKIAQDEFNRQEIEAENERKQAANAEWAARFGFGN